MKLTVFTNFSNFKICVRDKCFMKCGVVSGTCPRVSLLKEPNEIQRRTGYKALDSPKGVVSLYIIVLSGLSCSVISQIEIFQTSCYQF